MVVKDVCCRVGDAAEFIASGAISGGGSATTLSRSLVVDYRNLQNSTRSKRVATAMVIELRSH